MSSPSKTSLATPLLVGLLDIQVQVEPPLHACLQGYLQVATLRQLQAAGTEGPTMVWHRDPPGRHYCEWVSNVWHAVLTITPAQPPEPWIELQTEAAALFRHLVSCVTHKCLGHPNNSPLYMALRAPYAPPSELDPALRTHLREHFGVHTMLCPHREPTAAPMYLQPRTEPESTSMNCRRWPIIATDTITTPVGMAMARV